MKLLFALLGFIVVWVVMLGYAMLASDLFGKLHGKLGTLGFWVGLIAGGALFVTRFEARYPWTDETAWVDQYANALAFEFSTLEGLLITGGSFVCWYLSLVVMEDAKA